MKLRALQDCVPNTPLGPRYVHGPKLDADDRTLVDGETIEVPDDYVVNPDVFEVVTPPRSGQVRYVQPRRTGA